MREISANLPNEHIVRLQVEIEGLQQENAQLQAQLDACLLDRQAICMTQLAEEAKQTAISIKRMLARQLTEKMTEEDR